MNKIFIDSSIKNKGSFLIWTWELWEIGGGSGVEWFRFGKPIDIKHYNPLWIIFRLQSGLK